MPAAELLQAAADDLHQAVQIALLVVQRIERRAAAAFDFAGQLDHLVDRLLAGEPPDEILDDVAQAPLRFRRS